VAGKTKSRFKYESDYFTGYGMKAEDIWGHQLFDSDAVFLGPAGLLYKIWTNK